MSHLVDVAQLADLMRTGVRIIDVRWRLSMPGAGPSDGREDYLAGHIPGAVYADLETELTAHGTPQDGRHPFPTTQQVQDAVRRWGINDGDTVVAYDNAGGLAAARAWWLLCQGGVDIRVLDGGWRAWTEAGGEVEAGSVEYTLGNATLDDVTRDSITIDEAAEFPQHGRARLGALPRRHRTARPDRRSHPRRRQPADDEARRR